MRTETDAEIYQCIINHKAQDTKTGMIVKGKTNLLESENIKLKKQIINEKNNAKQVPELRKEIKSLKEQTMTLRSKLIDTVEREHVTELEISLKSKNKEQRKLTDNFDCYKNTVIQLDHKIGTFIEERNPDCCSLLKGKSKKFDLNSFEVRVHKLLEYMQDSEVRAKKSLALEKRSKAQNDENQILRINENKLVKQETNLTKKVAKLNQDVEQVPDLMNKISNLEKSVSNYQDLLSQNDNQGIPENSGQYFIDEYQSHVQSDLTACDLKARLLEKGLEVDKLKNKVEELSQQLFKNGQNPDNKRSTLTILNTLESDLNLCDNSQRNFSNSAEVKKLMKKVEFLENSQKSQFEERDYYKIQTEKIAAQADMLEKKCVQGEKKVMEGKKGLKELEEKKNKIKILELHNTELVEINENLRQKFRDYGNSQQGESGNFVEDPNTLRLLVEKEETINKHLKTIEEQNNQNNFKKKEINFLKSKLGDAEDTADRIPILVKEIQNLRLEKEDLTDRVIDKIKVKIETENISATKSRLQKIENEIADVDMSFQSPKIEKPEIFRDSIDQVNYDEDIVIVEEENDQTENTDFMKTDKFKKETKNEELNLQVKSIDYHNDLSRNVKNQFHSISSMPNENTLENRATKYRESGFSEITDVPRRTEQTQLENLRLKMKNNDSYQEKIKENNSNSKSETQRKIDDIYNENKRITAEFENLATKRLVESKNSIENIHNANKLKEMNVFSKMGTEYSSMGSFNANQKIYNNHRSDFVSENTLMLFSGNVTTQNVQDVKKFGAKPNEKMHSFDERLLFVNQELQSRGLLNQISEIEYAKTIGNNNLCENEELKKTIYKKDCY